ncbi:MAG: serine hydrolase [Acidiferrobacterales bacterium]
MKHNKLLRRIKSTFGITAMVLLVAKLVAAAEPADRTAEDPEDAQSKSRLAVPTPISAPTPVDAAKTIRYGDPNRLLLRSSVALIFDEHEGVLLYARSIDERRSIASLTKLMTALVILDAQLPLDEVVEITKADRDRLKGSASRLPYGTVLTRYDLLRIALAASDNRAAAALARTYPGGRKAAIQAMNEKAQALGMRQTRFTDPAGLHHGNVSTARDLAKLVYAIRERPLIGTLSTPGEFWVRDDYSGLQIGFRNTNVLVYKEYWDIALSKTGYTADAGNCLLMRTTIAKRPLVIILLNSWGKLSKFGDSNRIRRWLLDTEQKIQTHTGTTVGSRN